MTTYVQNNWRLHVIINKTQVQIVKRRQISYRIGLSTRISIWWSLPSWLGPRWNLGGYAENGVPSPQFFHGNHWGRVEWEVWRLVRGWWEEKSQPYSLDGSSDPAFFCQYCGNLSLFVDKRRWSGWQSGRRWGAWICALCTVRVIRYDTIRDAILTCARKCSYSGCRAVRCSYYVLILIVCVRES